MFSTHVRLFSNPSNNFLIALVTKQFAISWNLNKTDFCPQLCHFKSEMVASEAVAIKFHLPKRSTLSSVIHTLYDNSFHHAKYASVHGPTAFDFDGVTFINLSQSEVLFFFKILVICCPIPAISLNNILERNK